MTQERIDPDTGIKVYEQKSNGVIQHLSRAPRILLGLLTAWTILGVIATAMTSSPIFVDNHDAEIDGAMAGMAFMWPGVALAVVYIYCALNPDRFPKVFWLGGIQMTVAIVALLYHWVITGDFTAESVIIPLIGSAALLALILAYIAQDRDALAAENAAAKAVTPEKN